MNAPFDYEQLQQARTARPRTALVVAGLTALAGVAILVISRSEAAVLGGSWLIGVGAVIAIAAAFLRIGYDEDVDRAGESRRPASRRRTIPPQTYPRA
jgi:hypothetical protein